MQQLRFIHFVPFFAFFFFSLYLFTLPGQSIPQIGILELIEFDKWVHAAIFSILVSSALFPLKRHVANKKRTHTIFVIVTVLAIFYGIAIEFIQKYWIVNRSFDVFDILADSIGAVIGYVFSRRWLKKIGPDRNRGRNQN